MFPLIKGDAQFLLSIHGVCLHFFVDSYCPFSLNQDGSILFLSDVSRPRRLSVYRRAGFSHVEAPGQPSVVEAHPTFKY